MDCGDVELTTRDVRVLLCSTTCESTYAFQCPSCKVAVVKPAEARVVDVLLGAGIPLSVWQMPAELDEAHEGPPISYDDILELHVGIGLYNADEDRSLVDTLSKIAY